MYQKVRITKQTPIFNHSELLEIYDHHFLFLCITISIRKDVSRIIISKYVVYSTNAYGLPVLIKNALTMSVTNTNANAIRGVI